MLLLLPLGTVPLPLAVLGDEYCSSVLPKMVVSDANIAAAATSVNTTTVTASGSGTATTGHRDHHCHCRIVIAATRRYCQHILSA